MAKEPHGWRPDPFKIHDERFFNDGAPTNLVLDGEVAFLEDPMPATDVQPLSAASSAHDGLGPAGQETPTGDATPERDRAGVAHQATIAPHTTVEGSTGLPPPGWYHDPIGADKQRQWDGARWTDSVRPNPTPLPTSAGLQGAGLQGAGLQGAGLQPVAAPEDPLWTS